MTVYLVNETTLRQRLLPPEALGRAAATWQVATGLLTPAGALLGAVLAETIGLRPTLWVLAAGFAAAFVCSSSRALRCPDATPMRRSAACRIAVKATEANQGRLRPT